MTLPRITFIADDLTGANDSGVQIAKRGIETVTLLELGLIVETPSRAIVIDTESRTVSVERARELVRAAAQGAARRGGELFYKKIDSTLRGHIGAELDVLVRELAPDLVLCAPAYPKNGRTTRDGVHFVRGVPIEETEFAGDPINPVASSRLAEVLAGEDGPQFVHIGLEELRSGWSAGEGGRFFSFDCEEQEDLRRIVSAGRATGKRILWCGSAGLAEVLLEAVVPSGPKSAGRSASSGPATGTADSGARRTVAAAGARVLSVVGSMSEISRRQVGFAVEEGGARLVRLDPSSLLASPADEVERLVSALEEGGAAHVILSTAGPVPAGPITDARGDRITGGELAAAIARSLADAAIRLAARVPIAGLVLTGGETAIEVMRAAGAAGMRIDSELEPGVPAVRFIGGRLDGLPGVTKAGAFGSSETIAAAARYLRAAGARSRSRASRIASNP